MTTAKENKQQKFSDYVLEKTYPSLIKIPLIISLTVAIVAGICIIALRANSDFYLLNAISKHVDTLVSTHDRPELLRLLTSISKERNVVIKVVQNDRVLVTTNNHQELDLPFIQESPLVSGSHSYFDIANLVTTIKLLKSPNNTSLYIYTPIAPVLFSAISIGIFIFAVFVLFFYFYSKKISKVIGLSLEPIFEMEKFILNLFQESDSSINRPFGILELDRMREKLLEARRVLSDATEKLAHAKAQEMLQASYKQLLHDLYTPIAALNEDIQTSIDSNIEQEKVKKSNDRIIKIAKQILNQVTAINENLKVKDPVAQSIDIRQCLLEATEQSFLASGRRDDIKLVKEIPKDPIIIPHDPENLRRAISNLVSNAIHACNDQVHIKLAQVKNQVSIMISDDGPGIKSDDITPYFQGRIISNRGGRPSLGLPSANHIIRGHGGKLIYHQASLGGACFEIRI
jgi:signal transduction histidine kinase